MSEQGEPAPQRPAQMEAEEEDEGGQEAPVLPVSQPSPPRPRPGGDTEVWAYPYSPLLKYRRSLWVSLVTITVGCARDSKANVATVEFSVSSIQVERYASKYPRDFCVRKK